MLTDQSVWRLVRGRQELVLVVARWRCACVFCMVFCLHAVRFAEWVPARSTIVCCGVWGGTLPLHAAEEANWSAESRSRSPRRGPWRVGRGRAA